MKECPFKYKSKIKVNDRIYFYRFPMIHGFYAGEERCPIMRRN